MERYSILTEDILDDQIRYPPEGYLFPARYDFIEENPSIEVIIEAMLQRTEEVVNKYIEDL
ncbi:hypothetical protein KHA80_04395 [Anaerobacillus sp. HL2]|nr:hypothetical protein KHA80_04395 [Anaerobacillus sp. HL2]